MFGQSNRKPYQYGLSCQGCHFPCRARKHEVKSGGLGWLLDQQCTLGLRWVCSCCSAILSFHPLNCKMAAVPPYMVPTFQTGREERTVSFFAQRFMFLCENVCHSQDFCQYCFGQNGHTAILNCKRVWEDEHFNMIKRHCKKKKKSHRKQNWVFVRKREEEVSFSWTIKRSATLSKTLPVLYYLV